MAATPRFLLPTVLTASFMAILDVFVVNVATPSIQRDLGASSASIQWVVAAYALAYAMSLITGGRLGDAFGRRRLFRAGLALFTLASAACCAAPSPATLIAARAVQGLGAALMQPQALSMIQVEIPAADRPRAIALLGGVMGAGSVAGQLVGGALIALAGWRAVFAINIPVGVAAIAIAGRALPESVAAHARRLDLRGVALLTATLLLVIVPLVEGREAGWPLWVPVALVAALPLGALFVVHERRLAARGGAPLVDLDLFAIRPFVAGTAVIVALWATVPVFFVGLAQYLQRGHGESAIVSGLVFAPLAAAFFATSLLAPRLHPRIAGGAPRLMVLGALAAAVPELALAGILDGDAALPTIPLLIGLTIMGAGQGLVMPAAIAHVLRDVPVASAGSASGVLTTTQQTAAVLGYAIGGTLFFGIATDTPGPGALSDGLAALSLLAAAGALTAAAVLLAGREHRAHLHGESHPQGALDRYN